MCLDTHPFIALIICNFLSKAYYQDCENYIVLANILFDNLFNLFWNLILCNVHGVL